MERITHLKDDLYVDNKDHSLVMLLKKDKIDGPECNAIFKKKTIHEEILKEEKRPYNYQDETIYYYSDGKTVKDRRFHGSRKTIMETWRTKKEFYECQAKGCGHKWDRIKTDNLGKHNRPKPNEITTKTPVPNNFNNSPYF